MDGGDKNRRNYVYCHLNLFSFFKSMHCFNDITKNTAFHSIFSSIPGGFGFVCPGFEIFDLHTVYGDSIFDRK